MAEAAVLAVYDEKSILNSLRRSLRKEPYQLFIAESSSAGPPSWVLKIAREDALY